MSSDLALKRIRTSFIIRGHSGVAVGWFVCVFAASVAVIYITEVPSSLQNKKRNSKLLITQYHVCKLNHIPTTLSEFKKRKHSKPTMADHGRNGQGVGNGDKNINKPNKRRIFHRPTMIKMP